MRLANTLAALFGDDRCAGCAAPPTRLCATCLRLLARPSAAPNPPGVDRLIAAWEYEGSARRLVLDLKLRADRGAAGPLVDAMLAAGRRAGLEATWITWVPGRRSESARRGFDHAAVLAEGLSAGLGLPVRRALRRARSSVDLGGLPATERADALAGVFAPVRSEPDTAWAAPALLVDDLVTTGATASACAGVLRTAGVPMVEVIAPCRKS